MAFRTLAYALCALALTSVPAVAGQTMYRCGNNYQDTPCEGGGQMKRIGKTSAAVQPEAQATAEAQAPVDAECASRGQSSLKIVWAREAGATLERQLGEATTPRQRRLVTSVYEKRGSAPSIRSQIEAECQAEQEKLKQAQALAMAAAKLQEGLPQDAPAASSLVTSSERVPEVRRSAQTASTGEAGKSASCVRLRDSMESLRQQQRAGGNAAAMERMSQQKRNLESVMRTNGC